MWLTAVLCAAVGAPGIVATPGHPGHPGTPGTAGNLEAVGNAGDEPGICKRGLAAVTLAPPPEAPGVTAETDVLHYELDIEIDPSSQWIGGSNTITVRSLVNGLTAMQIRLDDSFNTAAVQVGGIPVTWQRLSGTTIEVDLDRIYDTAEQFDLFIAYDGLPVSLGFGSINFSTQGGNPLVFTLSEPWFAYTWWPAKDDNNDKATGAMKITVPDTLSVASNGLLVSVDAVGGGRDRYHWLTGYQTAPYLFSFSATVYNTFTGTYVFDGGSMPVEFFIFPSSDTPSHRQDWLKSITMLDAFGGIFGLYPFIDEKYGIYQFGFGGGMEHQTMTGQGGFGEWLTAHELGHQWWGDMVTCGTWQDIWLNEGFATYSEALWEEFKPGSSGAPALHAHMAGRRPSSVDGTVYVPAADAGNMGRIFSGSYSYRKAAWVLHQIRHVVGDATFFDILAAYRAAFAYGTAVTEDLRSVAEVVFGDDLAWFFDEWVYDIGAPEYRFAWRSHDIGGRSFVELYLAQVQSAAYPVFVMPLDVVMATPGGAAVEVVWNDAAAEHLLFEVADAPTGLELDPDDWTLHLSNTTTAFVEGPPKVAVTDPEPGGSLQSRAGMSISITFHKDVVVDASHVSIVGDVTGPAALTFSYDGGPHTVTLIAAAPLPLDSYTLTVQDGISDVAVGLALDGELSDPSDPQALPSGDGLPGGSAVIRFAVNPLGDLDGDGTVGISDFLTLLARWGPCPGPCPPSCDADLDGDCNVGITDLLMLLANWGP